MQLPAGEQAAVPGEQEPGVGGGIPPRAIAPEATAPSAAQTGGTGPAQSAGVSSYAAPVGNDSGSQSGSPQQQTSEPSGFQSFWVILKAGGLIGTLILLLSVAAVALVFEHAVTIRAAVLMPPGLADQVHRLVATGNVAAADQHCRTRPSLLAYVLSAGLAEAETDWPTVEKALEDATAEQSARLLRKIEYLSVISNIAPMLGLLGTVMGMIFAFRRVAETQGAARAADLAEGIYLALVTTVEGLIVAIPSLAAFAYFRNRVDQLVAEAAHAAYHALVPLKRRSGAAVARPAQPPGAPGRTAQPAPGGRPPAPPPAGR